MESMNGIQPMYDLADRNNNEFGGGYWIWIILLFLLFGGNWGNNMQNDTLMNQEFIKRDLFNTNQNVSSQGFQTSKSKNAPCSNLYVRYRVYGSQNRMPVIESSDHYVYHVLNTDPKHIGFRKQ